MNIIAKQNQNKEVSLRNAAIIAGIGLLIMAILAPLANFSILGSMIIPEDFAVTFENIVNAESQFRLAIFFFIIIAALDIVIAWALYIFLSPVNKSLSLLAAWFRIIYAAMLMFLLVYLIEVLQLLRVPDYLAVFGDEQLHARIMLLLMKFKQGWDFSLILFGFHLLVLGYLMFKARYMKKILGILLLIASFGYLIDGFGRVLSSDYHINIALYTFVGELVLFVWLLFYGWKARKETIHLTI